MNASFKEEEVLVVVLLTRKICSPFNWCHHIKLVRDILLVA